VQGPALVGTLSSMEVAIDAGHRPKVPYNPHLFKCYYFCSHILLLIFYLVDL